MLYTRTGPSINQGYFTSSFLEIATLGPENWEVIYPQSTYKITFPINNQ